MLTFLKISELHFFLLCLARLWNSQLCPPAAFCLVSYSVQYLIILSFLKFKFSVCTSGEIGSFWISSLSLQSHWLPPIGCLQFLTALACLDSTFVPNPVILPKTVLVSLLLAEPSFLVLAKICAKNMQIPPRQNQLQISLFGGSWHLESCLSQQFSNILKNYIFGI